ncbi:WhiB family transcriptional regulator [Fodinicola acaciae]|uniref:WhiB family transcriptional regulator n=1 Tax=Fodinicola acaciae TaxID=2681555 RepID=UPI0013D6A61B|nr:WhiB family transcriptional regulator [Fodinicola acaciae]
MAMTKQLPRPVAESWDWQRFGRCRQADADPDAFFHPIGERDPARSRRTARAKALCTRCPVLRRCREYALSTREPYGIWGGLDEHEREQLLAARRVA